MKKSRMFMAIAIMVLTMSGVAATRTAKKYTIFGPLYYYSGTGYVTFSPGCFNALLTLTHRQGAQQAAMAALSNQIYKIYYKSTLLYVPVYSTIF